MFRENFRQAVVLGIVSKWLLLGIESQNDGKLVVKTALSKGHETLL